MVLGINYASNVTSTMKMIIAMAAIIPTLLTLSTTSEHPGKFCLTRRAGRVMFLPCMPGANRNYSLWVPEL